MTIDFPSLPYSFYCQKLERIDIFHGVTRTVKCCLLVLRTTEGAKELAEKVGGKSMPLSEVENFHPEEGMVLANATSVGMKPDIDQTPIPKVCSSSLLIAGMK